MKNLFPVANRKQSDMNLKPKGAKRKKKNLKSIKLVFYANKHEQKFCPNLISLQSESQYTKLEKKFAIKPKWVIKQQTNLKFILERCILNLIRLFKSRMYWILSILVVVFAVPSLSTKKKQTRIHKNVFRFKIIRIYIFILEK